MAEKHGSARAAVANGAGAAGKSPDETHGESAFSESMLKWLEDGDRLNEVHALRAAGHDGAKDAGKGVLRDASTSASFSRSGPQGWATASFDESYGPKRWMHQHGNRRFVGLLAGGALLTVGALLVLRPTSQGLPEHFLSSHTGQSQGPGAPSPAATPAQPSAPTAVNLGVAQASSSVPAPAAPTVAPPSAAPALAEAPAAVVAAAQPSAEEAPVAPAGVPPVAVAPAAQAPTPSPTAAANEARGTTPAPAAAAPAAAAPPAPTPAAAAAPAAAAPVVAASGAAHAGAPAAPTPAAVPVTARAVSPTARPQAEPVAPTASVAAAPSPTAPGGQPAPAARVADAKLAAPRPTATASAAGLRAATAPPLVALAGPPAARTGVAPEARPALGGLTPAAATTPVQAQAAAPALDPQQALDACQRAVESGAPRKALDACRGAVAANQSNAASLILFAQAKLLVGRDNEAFSLAKRALEADPANAEAYLILGSIAQGIGNTAEARRSYETYLRVAPQGTHASEIRAILRTM